jgi:Trypsin
MLDFRSLPARNRFGRLAARTQRAPPGIVLLLAVTAGVAVTAGSPGGYFIDTAAAQSIKADLNSVQRRLLAARLKDRLKALQHDVGRGRHRIRADLANWTGGEARPLMKDIFDSEKPVRSIPDVADNIYERMIKEYVAFKRQNQPKPWNPWPEIGTTPYPDQVKEITFNDQQNYVKCVLKRVDHFFGMKWEYLNKLIAAIEQNGLHPEINDISGGGATTLGKAVRAALTFKGGIRQYLGDIPFSPAVAKRSADDSDLDPIRRCPVELDLGDAGNTSVGSLPLSVDWNAKCLQSDALQPGGKVNPYHPTTAALMFDNGRSGTGLTTYCSGTLIAPHAVLTAAHCICETAAKDPGGQFYRTAAACRAGRYSRLGSSVSTLDPDHQTVFLQHAGHFQISHIVVHPQFRWTGDLPASDLAILFLERPVPGIAPMPLNSLRRLPPGTKAAAVGYGAHNPIGAEGAITDTATVLEQAGLKLQANTITAPCNLRARSRKLICWSYRAERVGVQLGSTCRGDSGGPLYAESGNQTYLVGVTSGGGPSCQPDTEAYDTEVYAYRDWILRQLVLNTPPHPRGGLLPSLSGLAGSDGMTQLACHFCSLCDQLEATVPTPDKARRVQVSANCTPDEATRRNELTLEVSTGDGRKLCSTAGPKGTAVSCTFPVAGNEALTVKLNTGLLQQCQIVATAFDRRD